MNINSRLYNLYAPHWPSLIEYGFRVNSPVPTNPLLLCFDEAKYLCADKRILICGQETWGWGKFGSSIEHCMASYRSFFIDGEYYDGYGVSAFWKAFRYFETHLSKIFEGLNIQFIWENLSKIGRNDGATGVTNDIRTLERQYFPILREEITLLKPDIVLFLTGPDRDHDIRFHFPDAKYIQAGDEANLRRRAWISSSYLPVCTLRLYHPSYYAAWTNTYKAEAVSLINNMSEQGVAGYRRQSAPPA